MNKLKLNYNEDVVEGRKHVIWYDDKKPYAEGEFGDGKVIIVAEGTTRMEICSYDRKERYLTKVGDGQTAPKDILNRILKDDSTLQRILDDTHGIYYSRLENTKKWVAYYVEGEKRVFLGELNSFYLNECMEELETNYEHIPDLIQIQREW